MAKLSTIYTSIDLSGDIRATDSDLLDGHDASHFAVAEHHHDTRYHLNDWMPGKADVGLGHVNNYSATDALEDVFDKYATAASAYTAYTTAKSDILGGTPSAQLDTLTELSAALEDNEDAVVAINATLATKASVDHQHDTPTLTDVTGVPAITRTAGLYKSYTFDLTAYDNSQWFPILFTGSFFSGLVHRFNISTTTGGWQESINSNQLFGEVRGGGSTDRRKYYSLYKRLFDHTEQAFGDIYTGTASFVDAVLYVRGGLSYYVNTTSNATVYTSTKLIADATFSAGDTTPVVTNAKSLVDVSTIPEGKFIYLDLTLTGHIKAGKSVTATEYVTSSSDVRLKTNIQTITDPLDKIRRLRGCVFNRIDLNNTLQSGLIAQDVLDVMPELVNTQGDYYTLAYGNMAGVFVEAIKALEDRIHVLETQRLE